MGEPALKGLPVLWEHTRLWFASGGPVMVPLLAVGLWLWFLLGLRLLDLHREAGRALGKNEVELIRRRMGLQRHAAMIDTLIVAAPLLGLLGTISGMMTTFDALTVMALFTQGGGIAGGISEALVTTEMGLGIAVPGLLLQRWLRHRARRLERRADEVLVLVTQGGAPGAGEED